LTASRNAAAILTCVGIGLTARGVHASGWQALAIGVIVVIGTLVGRRRYRHIDEQPKGDWQRQFIDSTTGDPVELMFKDE
jgi:hypothetical protein